MKKSVKQFSTAFIVSSLSFSALTFVVNPIQVYHSIQESMGASSKSSDVVYAEYYRDEGESEKLLEVHLPLLRNIQDNLPHSDEERSHDELVRSTAEEIPLCEEGSTVKSYMDGSTVTNTASVQYQLLSTMRINEKGQYETDDGYIAIALGSYYGPVGSKYIIELDTGITFKAIKSDQKSDEHVYNGCQHRVDGSMLEFILDTETAGNYFGMKNGYVCGGNLNNSSDYNGAITSIKKVTID